MDRQTDAARITAGDSPLIAAAIHDGHALRSEIARLIALSESDRLREEDPFTARWAEIAQTRIVGERSRFEVDLNRPRDGAVYLTPEQAWSLEVWKEPLPPEVIDRSLAMHDAFYDELRQLLDGIVEKHGRFVVYDIHSYNHRRDGPHAEPAAAARNPEINVGTSNMPPGRWDALVARFVADMARGDPERDRPFDVRVDVKFKGGFFSRWVHENYPDTGCSLAIEMKKFFMDEWTGEPFETEIRSVRRALEATVPGVLEELFSA